MKTMSAYHCGVAAEAFAAGLFAQAGYDVAVQYGANQPLYDLVITRGVRAIHVSVKGAKMEDGDLFRIIKKDVAIMRRQMPGRQISIRILFSAWYSFREWR